MQLSCQCLVLRTKGCPSYGLGMAAGQNMHRWWWPQWFVVWTKTEFCVFSRWESCAIGVAEVLLVSKNREDLPEPSHTVLPQLLHLLCAGSHPFSLVTPLIIIGAGFAAVAYYCFLCERFAMRRYISSYMSGKNGLVSSVFQQTISVACILWKSFLWRSPAAGNKPYTALGNKHFGHFYIIASYIFS